MGKIVVFNLQGGDTTFTGLDGILALQLNYIWLSEGSLVGLEDVVQALFTSALSLNLNHPDFVLTSSHTDFHFGAFTPAW